MYCSPRDSGSSPHTRGAPALDVGGAQADGIIPAYAGSTALTSDCSWAGRDHPRIRGEHATVLLTLASSSGSSPHTRGALAMQVGVDLLERIIPAYAGSTDLLGDAFAPIGDHPRIRGEHVYLDVLAAAVTGSSPHTRGAQHSSGYTCCRTRIIPAYAGSTGETERVIAKDPGIIPAYAGSTTSSSLSWRLERDHPRIRGEHGCRAVYSLGELGSSPHTRGAHLGIPAIPRIAAVIIPVFLYPSPTPQEEADRSMVLLTLS